MFYCQKFDTFIRIYDDVGYIANKSDFSDRVVSQSGAVFLSVLSRQAQELDELTKKSAEKFVGIDVETLKRDVKKFYDMLETDDL